MLYIFFALSISLEMAIVWELVTPAFRLLLADLEPGVR